MPQIIPTAITKKTVDPTVDPTGGQTLLALQLRQKQLAEAAPTIPSQIPSPWQGASLMANSLVNSLQQNAAAEQEAAGRKELTQTMMGAMDPTTGMYSQDAIAKVSALDPEYGRSLTEQNARALQELAKYKQSRIDKAEDLKAERAPKLTDIASIRGDVTGDASYKNMAQAAPMWSSMQDAYTRDTPQADLNMVIALAKMFDPTSVVRSEEGKAVELTGNAPASLKAQFLYLVGGKGSRLDPEVRKGMMQEAASRMRGYVEAYGKTSNFYTEMAKRYGINPADIVPTFGDLKLDAYDPAKKDDPTITLPTKPDGSIDYEKLTDDQLKALRGGK